MRNIEKVESSAGLVTVLVDTHHNGTLQGAQIIKNNEGGSSYDSIKGVWNSYTLADSGATIHLSANNQAYFSAWTSGQMRWVEQETVTATVHVDGATQSGQIYDFNNSQILFSGGLAIHSGYSTMVGTNHGDTVTMGSTTSGFGSYGWIGFVSGLGDDTITINDDYTKAAVVYTGGDDVIYGHLEQLSLAPDIELQDVSVGSITASGYDVETGAVLYSAVLSIAGHGSIAVENFAADNGLGFQAIQIVLQSEAGYVDVSTDGTMTLSAEPLSYPVLMGGDEVHWGHSRTMVGTDADDVFSRVGANDNSNIGASDWSICEKRYAA